MTATHPGMAFFKLGAQSSPNEENSPDLKLTEWEKEEQAILVSTRKIQLDCLPIGLNLCLLVLLPMFFKFAHCVLKSVYLPVLWKWTSLSICGHNDASFIITALPITPASFLSSFLG